jgi:hypothetical protein
MEDKKMSSAAGQPAAAASNTTPGANPKRIQDLLNLQLTQGSPRSAGIASKLMVHS